MQTRTQRTLAPLLTAALTIVLAVATAPPASRAAEEATAAADGKAVFNGKDLAGWRMKDPSGAKAWSVVADVALDPADPRRLLGNGEGASGRGVLLRGPAGHGSDVYTEQAFGDCEVHVEFMVPKGSNSGVYLMGRYEVQVFDSFGKEKVGPGDVGGLYNTAAPRENAAKAPGEWQALHVVFQAPRFDASGKKTASAKFVRVTLNGRTIHEDVEVPKPTGGQLENDEKPTGPLMFQGDHGVVAFRNVRVKEAAGR